VTDGFGFALSLAVIPLLTVLVIAPLLAYAAHRAGRPARWMLRLGLAIPMVCFAPTALATAWLLARGRAGLGQQASEPGWMVRLAIWSTLFGLVCGVGVTLYLAALRAREPGRSLRPAVVAVGGLATVAVIAASLQVYAHPMLLSGDRAITPIVAQFETAFVDFRVGPAAAQATLLLGVLAVLGLLATAVVILTGLRIEVDPVSRWLEEEPAGWRSRSAATVGGLGTAGVLVVTGYGLWPWLTRLGGGSAPAGVSATSVLANTWLPPLVSTVVGVGVALLAGFGIGALRPLGRWSEVLLLPFAPWLFVGLGPLSLAGIDRVRAAGQLNTFAGLIPPTWLAIPALVIFAALFRGLAANTPRAGPGLVRPALPMVVLLFGATLLVRAQDLSWSYVVAADAEHLTGPLLAVRQLAELPASHVSVGLVLPVMLVASFAIALGALQVGFLDRVTLRLSNLRAPAPHRVTDPGQPAHRRVGNPR
jgi:MFS family permease